MGRIYRLMQSDLKQKAAVVQAEPRPRCENTFIKHMSVTTEPQSNEWRTFPELMNHFLWITQSHNSAGKRLVLSFMWMLLWHVPPTYCILLQATCYLMAVTFFHKDKKLRHYKKLFGNGLGKLIETWTCWLCLHISIFIQSICNVCYKVTSNPWTSIPSGKEVKIIFSWGSTYY